MLLCINYLPSKVKDHLRQIKFDNQFILAPLTIKTHDPRYRKHTRLLQMYQLFTNALHSCTYEGYTCVYTIKRVRNPDDKSN